MRPHNNVGGYRIYPSSIAIAEAADAILATIGQFNDGMDRLNQERELSEHHEAILATLPSNSQIQRNHRQLSRRTAQVWQSALQCQQDRQSELGISQDDMQTTSNNLHECADSWRELKRQLDERG